MSIKFFEGYWTVFSGAQPVISFTSLARALAALRS
jgi:hypothetical protein